MAEFFLELFSEEIPPKLQANAREKIKFLFENQLKKKNIKFSNSKSFSTPKRLVFVFDGIPKKIIQDELVLKGPKVDTPPVALEGFIKSNNLFKTDVYQEETDKGKFYFAKIKSQTIDVENELSQIIPKVLKNYSWPKAMKWSSYDLIWGRPLNSIIALFDKKIVNFKFYHLNSNNLAEIDVDFNVKQKIVKDFKTYNNFLKLKNIILDQDIRKKIIITKLKKICKSRNFHIENDDKLLDEVTNLVENPNVLIGKFDKSFLKIPNEILIITMKQHQKYFPLFYDKNKLANFFIFVSNLKDIKKYIKTGNEKVITARLSDAKFFWDKNKKQNLVKQISKLKNLTFFKELGTVYDKTQRIRKIGSLISDNLNLNKEKIEIAASICKSDLVSDLVGEYPELQGVMGKYFAEEQGFDENVSLAIKEHYLPLGTTGIVAKKPISYVVSIADKIDTLVGFFGTNEKPTSSKDPFALKRTAIGLIKTIIDNEINIKLKDIIVYSSNLYKEQNLKLINDRLIIDIINFLRDRTKHLLKDKKVRLDIIEAAISSHMNDDFVLLYKKCLIVNKNISKDLGKNIVSTYKRASNILGSETKNEKYKIQGLPDSVLFKKEEEKILFDKINEIRKYFSSTYKKQGFDESFYILGEAKLSTDNFFDKVIVNDENSDIKKNRLELLQMLCKTYDNFIDFSKVERI